MVGPLHQAPGPGARLTAGSGAAYAGLPSGGQVDRAGGGGPPGSVHGGGVGCLPQSSASFPGELVAS
jgi:hypothetical protein